MMSGLPRSRCSPGSGTQSGFPRFDMFGNTPPDAVPAGPSAPAPRSCGRPPRHAPRPPWRDGPSPAAPTRAPPPAAPPPAPRSSRWPAGAPPSGCRARPGAGRIPPGPGPCSRSGARCRRTPGSPRISCSKASRSGPAGAIQLMREASQASAGPTAREGAGHGRRGLDLSAPCHGSRGPLSWGQRGEAAAGRRALGRLSGVTTVRYDRAAAVGRASRRRAEREAP